MVGCIVEAGGDGTSGREVTDGGDGVGGFASEMEGDVTAGGDGVSGGRGAGGIAETAGNGISPKEMADCIVAAGDDGTSVIEVADGVGWLVSAREARIVDSGDGVPCGK